MNIEEIIKAASAYYPSGILNEAAKVSGFVRGAKWADKMMLDRACEWLQEILNEYDDGSGYTIVCSTEFATAKEFVEYFRKAMEGGAE